MSEVVRISGFVVIASIGTVFFVWSQRRRADAELLAFAETVPAELTVQVRDWLGPELLRRSVYPQVGWMWGFTAALIPLTPGRQLLPWYWFAVVICSVGGSAAGSMLAWLRTSPLADGSPQTVDPAPHRLTDFLDPSQTLRLRLAGIVAAAAVALVCAAAAAEATALAGGAFLACGLGALLVGAHHLVITTVIGGPIVARSPEGVLWQRALVAKTVDPMPRSAFLIGLLSGAAAVSASMVDFPDPPPTILLLGACVALLTMGSAAAAVVSVRRVRQQSREPVPSDAA